MISIVVFLIDFFVLINQSIPIGSFWRKAGQFIGLICLIVFVLCVIYLFISWFINIFKKTKELKTNKPESQPKTDTAANSEKIKEKKKWQPVNIILGLLIMGCTFYFAWSSSSFIAIIRLIPAILLILTRKNNIFVSIVLLLFGLTIAIVPTFDAFLLLVSAVYMFSSALLRVFKIKQYIAIGSAIALVFGLWMLFGPHAIVLQKRPIFFHENKLVMVKEIDSRSNIVLSSSRNDTDISTAFNPGLPIYPVWKGLQKSGSYACRIIDKAGNVVIPLDKWPVFKIQLKSDGNNDWQSGVFNDGDYLPLRIGDYIIQLVRVEKGQGIIIAESNFSIVPYDKQTLSEIVAYLTSDNDPGIKFYDSYTVKTDKFGVKLWVQAPKGKIIAGTVKFYKTNYDGIVEKTSWDSEYGFKTGADGKPLFVRAMGGRIPPGIYHFQIMLGDTVVADLKLII